MNGKKFVVMAILLACGAAFAFAEADVVVYGSTGLGTDALKGYVGQYHAKDRIEIFTDESPVYLFFSWDSDMQPHLSIADKAGRSVQEVDLTKGDVVTLDKPGDYVCTLTAKSGSGHWLCVLLGGREWDK